MNGEVKSYRLNSPMDWAEFKSMPDDLKVVYIKALRNKYGVPDAHIGNMMGIHKCSFMKEMARLNLSKGEHCGGRRKWDQDGFFAWVNGADIPTPVIEETEVEIKQDPENIQDNESFIEEDIPFYENYCTEEKTKVFTSVPELATPTNGSMEFKCPAKHALNMLEQILGQTNCEIYVRWRVVPERVVDNG